MYPTIKPVTIDMGRVMLVARLINRLVELKSATLSISEGLLDHTHCLMVSKKHFSADAPIPGTVFTIQEASTILRKSFCEQTDQDWQVVFAGTEEECRGAGSLIAERLGIKSEAPVNLTEEVVRVAASVLGDTVDAKIGICDRYEEDWYGACCLMFDRSKIGSCGVDPWAIYTIGEAITHNISYLYAFPDEKVGDLQIAFMGTREECLVIELIFVNVLSLSEFFMASTSLSDEDELVVEPTVVPQATAIMLRYVQQ